MTSNLRAIRIGLGMTQRELAAVFGQTAANVSHYENGKQELPPACARALIAAAQSRGRGLTFDEIYGVPKVSAGETAVAESGAHAMACANKAARRVSEPCKSERRRPHVNPAALVNRDLFDEDMGEL